MTSLQNRPFNMLHQSCWWRRDSVVLTLLTSKLVQASLINFICFTCPVVHDHHKFFNDAKLVVCNWPDWSTETSEYLSSSLKHIPCLPCRLFSFSNKSGYCVSLWTRGKKGELYILAQAPLSSDEPESTESLSLFRRQSTIHWYEINENSQDNNICVWTTDGYVFLPVTAACLAWKKHKCVSFFVIARCKISCIDVTVADNNVIFSYDAYIISNRCDDLISQKSKQFSFVLIAPKESVPWFRRSWIACYLPFGAFLWQLYCNNWAIAKSDLVTPFSNWDSISGPCSIIETSWSKHCGKPFKTDSFSKLPVNLTLLCNICFRMISAAFVRCIASVNWQAENIAGPTSFSNTNTTSRPLW